MCGIAVLRKLRGSPADPAEIRRMSSAIRHRGPDGAGFARLDGGTTLFGHVRLSVVDPLTGAQPIYNEDGSICLTFNGEIYDYQAHRERLAKLGHRFSTAGDSEVIVHLYEEHGLDFVRHLNGEFAFVLWDGRTRRLVGARDRFGVKPLFYALTPQEIALGSEAKAILALDRFRRGVDPAYLAGPFFGAMSPAASPFAGVRQVRPGHVLVVGADGQSTETPYWQPAFRPDRSISFHDACEGVRERMTAAVRRRMVADVPVGAYLSGGVDSTIVCGLMARERAGLRAFNLSFEGTIYDEAPAAAKTAEHFGITLESTPCTPRLLAQSFLSTIFHVESVLNNPNSVAKRLLSGAARAASYKVCLTGEGADELFGGYAFFKLERIWQMLLGAPDAARSGEELWRLFQKVEHRTEGILWRKRMPWRQREYAWGYPSYYRRTIEQADPFARRLIARGMHAGASEGGPIAALDRELPPARLRALDPFDASRLVSLNALASYIIPTLGDRVEMASSLECRTPFLDVELADFALRLPPEHFMKIETLREKHVLREAFADLLPPAVNKEPKHPFMAPTWGMLRATREGAELFEDLLSTASLERAGLFEPRAIRLLRLLWIGLPPSGLARMADATMGLVLSMMALSRTLVERPIPSEDLRMEDRTETSPA